MYAIRHIDCTYTFDDEPSIHSTYAYNANEFLVVDFVVSVLENSMVL